MYSLRIHLDAQQDLRALLASDEQAATAAKRILAFLQELKATPAWLDELLTRHFENDEFNVDKFVTFWKAGLDLWRIKVFEHDFSRHATWTLPYRLIYAYSINARTFYVLGVVPREFDYDENHELTKRICRTYDDLDLPKHKLQVHHSSYQSH
jgi:hypothetical protein